ncbi:MAG: DNA topoisomerase IV subunit A, partial [Nitrososphaerales archaeon]
MKRLKKEIAKTKKAKVKELLKDLGVKVYKDLDNAVFPEVSIPSRSVSNIVYDKKLRQYILGNGAVNRSAKNMRHLRPFTQLIWMAFFINKLLNQGKSSTLRDIYYSAQAFAMDFEDQPESDHT